MAFLLDYLKESNADVYKSVCVTMIDASAPFVKVQEKTLRYLVVWSVSIHGAMRKV